MSNDTKPTAAQGDAEAQVVGPIDLAADDRAPRAARRAAARALDELGVSTLTDPVTLLVSEIVSNTVVHTSCEHITLTVRLVSGRVRIECQDCDHTGNPTLTDADRETPGGFGLHIVDEVATNWGVTRLPDSKIVWFEILLPTTS